MLEPKLSVLFIDFETHWQFHTEYLSECLALGQVINNPSCYRSARRTTKDRGRCLLKTLLTCFTWLPGWLLSVVLCRETRSRPTHMEARRSNSDDKQTFLIQKDDRVPQYLIGSDQQMSGEQFSMF